MSDDIERRTGVLLMAYGTPRHPDEIEAYYTDIRRGRPPTPEALADLVARYDAIGGISPLAAITERQRDALQRALDDLVPGRFQVGLGLKHADPKVEQGAAELVNAGVDSIVGVVLAPHYSSYSVGQYHQRARDEIERIDDRVAFHGVDSWATERAFVTFLADDLRSRHEAMASKLAEADDDRTIRVVFTAHSLPTRIIDQGDPYPDELRATAEAVGHDLRLTEHDDWIIGWQSAGRTPEPWIGPDILDVIDALGTDPDVGGVIVSACGFVADHLEVLFDLDIEARHRADDAGLLFDRTASVNDDSSVIEAVAQRVVEAVERGATQGTA